MNRESQYRNPLVCSWRFAAQAPRLSATAHSQNNYTDLNAGRE